MKTRLSNTRSYQCMRERLSQKAAIWISIIGLLLLSSLAGCGVGGSALGASLTPPKSAGTTWKLVWSDEFNGPAGTPPDASKWSAKVGGGGWGHKQLDYDTNNQNAYQDGQGHLVLEARKNTSNKLLCWYGPCRYTSAQITTESHFSFTYGLLEASIKLPQGQGLWSAFWILGDNCATVGWPKCGEMDVMENIGKEPAIIYGSFHGPTHASSPYKLKQGKFSDDFHVFAIKWEPNHIYFMVDGNVYRTIYRDSSFPDPSDWVYDHPFYIILALPVGGTWPGSPNATTSFPQKMSIDYIRFYTGM